MTFNAAPKPPDRNSKNIKRLNINLPESTHKILNSLATDTQLSMTEIVRIGLGLAVIACDERKKGNRLVVVDENGEYIKEIIMIPY